MNNKSRKNRSSSARGGSGSGGRGPGRGPEKQVSADGVYTNHRFLQTTGTLCGLTVQIQTRTNELYEGVFTTCSSAFEVVLDMAHPVSVTEPGTLNPETVKRKMIFKASDIVTLKAANVDLEYATKDGFATDAAISRYNGSVTDERELVPWNDDDGIDGTSCPLEDPNGWGVHDMFIKNQALGVTTTYTPEMEGYTTTLIPRDTPEYRENIQRATRIADEIENSPLALSRSSLENGDEEERFAAVTRPESSGNPGKYVPPQLRGDQGGDRDRRKPQQQAANKVPRSTPPPQGGRYSGGQGAHSAGAPPQGGAPNHPTPPASTAPMYATAAGGSAAPSPGGKRSPVASSPSYSPHGQGGGPPSARETVGNHPSVNRQSSHGGNNTSGEAKLNGDVRAGSYGDRRSHPREGSSESNRSDGYHSNAQGGRGGGYHHGGYDQSGSYGSYDRQQQRMEQPPREQREPRRAQPHRGSGKEEQVADLKKFGQNFKLSAAPLENPPPATSPADKRGPPSTASHAQPPPAQLIPNPQASPHSQPPAPSHHPPPMQQMQQLPPPLQQQMMRQPSPPTASISQPMQHLPAGEISLVKGDDEKSPSPGGSKLNPNAKEFVFNPNAKPFSPATPTPQMPPVAQQAPPPHMAGPSPMEYPPGATHMVPAYVMASPQFAMQAQPQRFTKRVPSMGGGQRPEYTSSPMQVAAATGQPILTPNPQQLPNPQALAAMQLPQMMAQNQQAYRYGQQMPMMVQFTPGGGMQMVHVVPTSMGMYPTTGDPQQAIYMTSASLPPQHHVGNQGGPHPAQPPTPQGGSMPTQPPTPGPTPPQQLMYNAAAPPHMGGQPQQHLPHPAQSPHPQQHLQQYQMHNPMAGPHHPSSGGAPPMTTQLVMLNPGMNPHMMAHGAPPPPHGAGGNGGHMPSSMAGAYSTASSMQQQMVQQQQQQQHFQYFHGNPGQGHPVSLIHHNQ